MRTALLLLIALALCTGARSEDLVRVAGGLVAGSGAPGSVRAFKGVPFAAPPVGPLRWRPPQPVVPWNGVRRADAFGPSAPQAETGPFGPWTSEFIYRTPPSEDCLYLNVWTAAKSPRARRPVLVYIHGGAFLSGSGDVAVYDGAALARKGLVVVTINYRLGVLGFFAHPDLRGESETGTAGNYGLLDQVAALRWVKNNIAAFGGDPGNVTIAGQSAGAASVHLLMASPQAKALFHRAIAQSGSGVGHGLGRPRAVAERDAVAFAREKGATSLARLRALSAADLVATPPGGNALRFGPVVDGAFVLEESAAPASDVPVLTGLTADEGSFSPTYGALSPHRKQAQRDQGIVSMGLWAKLRAKTARTKTFLYYLARAIPWPQHPEFGAFHTSEVPYVFANLTALDRPWETVDRQLSERMAAYWTNFATRGDPNGTGLPRWPAFDQKRPQFQRLDADIAPMPLPAGLLVHDRLAPGFLPESMNAQGYPAGFETPNPWGAYTAYLLATNAKGHRTWRIENYVAMGSFLQGSTMYLLEGSQRALLIDTAQETADTPGKNDLTSVVRHLLGHGDDGVPRPQPVDFIVANTHSHFDHTGENAQMSDRTIYYPDLDWPKNAPENYVPIRQGGGPTSHGNGQAIGRIELGERTIEAFDLYGHTPGSMGYLDRENNVIVTGDAIGSGVVWMHFGPVERYARSLRQLKAALAPMGDPAILPAHFYQIAAGDRAKPPISGRLLDRGYVDDQLAAAQGTLDGSVVGEPYRIVGRDVALALVRSAGMTYALRQVAQVGQARYRALRIPGTHAATQSPSPIDSIRSELYLIREADENTLYLIRGPAGALLIGAGGGTPGLAAFLQKLIGDLPLDVAVLSESPGQTGGLGLIQARTLYLPRSMVQPPAARAQHIRRVGQGDTIELGADPSGMPVALQVEPLPGYSPHALTLLDEGDRVLFSGDALGEQGANGQGLVLSSSLTDFSTALAAFRARTDGRYGVIYTARNAQWLTHAAFVDQIQEALQRGLAGSAAKSSGPADVVATITLRSAVR